MAEELGLTGLSASADVTVNIVDENDNAPKFSDEPYDVTIPENVRPGTVIVQVRLVEGFKPERWNIWSAHHL